MVDEVSWFGEHFITPPFPNEIVTKNKRHAAPTVDPLNNSELPDPDGTAAYVTTSARNGITTENPNTTASIIALADAGNPGTAVILGTSRNRHHRKPNHMREDTMAKPCETSASTQSEKAPPAVFGRIEKMKMLDTACIDAITDTVSTNMNTRAGMRKKVK